MLMEGGWTIGQFIIGIIVGGIGFILVWKADWFLKNFGSVPFAEKYLSTEGGSRLFYKLFGMLIMVGGMMHAVGILAPTIQWLVDQTFGQYFGPPKE